MKYFPYSPFLARCGSQTTRQALTWNHIRNSDASPTHLSRLKQNPQFYNSHVIPEDITIWTSIWTSLL